MTAKTLRNFARGILGRESVKLLLRPMVRWRPMDEPEAGFSIVLGVPWHLRTLLPVNLRFVAGTNLARVRRIHVVFDRRTRPEMAAIAQDALRRFPGMPLEFHSYPPISGRIVEAVNVSTFYNSMNCALALARVTTRFAVMHDFDLFPLVPTYFEEVVQRMERDSLRFCGLERTYHDGLTDADGILGTWCLGVDAQWLRSNYRPVDIFHKIERVRGEWVTLDPFSSIQRRTPERSLVGSIDAAACCHVRNLCATYLRHRSGERVKFSWKLHYLWYLEALNGDDRLDAITSAMDSATDGVLRLPDGTAEDFGDVDPTCANVLESELRTMDAFLFGQCRPEVEAYLSSFRAFLRRAAAQASRPATHA